MKSGQPVAKSNDSKNWDPCYSVKIATWNILTLHKTGYQVAASREMGQLDVHVTGLTETHINRKLKVRCRRLYLAAFWWL